MKTPAELWETCSWDTYAEFEAFIDDARAGMVAEAELAKAWEAGRDAAAEFMEGKSLASMGSFSDRIRALQPPGGKAKAPAPSYAGVSLNYYQAVNLREALKLVPCTGDWHCELWWACDGALKAHPDATPNVRAEDQKCGIDQPNCHNPGKAKP